MTERSMKEIVLVVGKSFEESENFFINRENENAATMWKVVGRLAKSLEQEVLTPPGSEYSLTREENSKVSYPLLTEFSEAARNLGDFHRALTLCGQLAGFVPVDKVYTPYEIYGILNSGESSVNSLSKSLFITRAFYRDYEGETVIPSDKIMLDIYLVSDYFQPHKVLIADLGMDERIGLSDLKDVLYSLKHKIMDMDQGEVNFTHDNRNGSICFYENGAVRVAISDVQVFRSYRSSMLERKIKTNSGAFYEGETNVYTIPAGVDILKVVEGLEAAKFIGKEEGEEIKKRLHPRNLLS